MAVLINKLGLKSGCYAVYCSIYERGDPLSGKLNVARLGDMLLEGVFVRRYLPVYMRANVYFLVANQQCWCYMTTRWNDNHP